jgi:hypothetical protein
MNLKGCIRKRLWSKLRYYTGMCLEGLRKATLSQYILSPNQDLKPRPPEQEAGMLPNQRGRSVK